MIGWLRRNGRRLLVDLAVFAAVAIAVTVWQTRDLRGSGEQAPAFALERLGGAGGLSLAELRGRKVLLLFWAPWCGVCKAEVGAINSIAESAGDDVAVVSVALAYEDVASVERFVREHDVRFPVVLGDERIARDYAVGAYPTLYVIDEEGNVEHAAVGYTTELGLRLRLL